MAQEIFTSIYTSMSTYFGFEWIAFTLLFMAMGLIILTLLEVDVLLAVSIVSLPLLVFVMYNTITLGAWGISVIVLLLGLILALSTYRLLFK